MPEFEGIVPQIRTIQAIIKKYRDRIGAEPWTVVDATPEDSRLVLPFVANMWKVSEGRRRITRREAEWIIRLARVVPLVDFEMTWGFVSEYLRAQDEGEDTIAIDVDLGRLVIDTDECPDRFRINE